MTDADLGRIDDGAIATKGDRIAWVGAEKELPGDPAGLAGIVHRPGPVWLLPGLIDCHTHLVFGGDRSDEFRQRLHGKSYEEIARSGGGIRSTVAATRAASEAELVDSARRRARDWTRWGVTTLEVKSGYGLDLDTELRMLRVAAALGPALDVDIHPTLLAAHSVPDEFEGQSDRYVEFVLDQILPAAVNEGHARGIDVFCETLAFSPAQSRRVLEAGIDAGLVGRIHADQLSDGGGGRLAAEVGARSADHLEFLSQDGVKAMAEAGVVAGLLPGAFYSLQQDQAPPVEALRSAGVDLAVATDANPRLVAPVSPRCGHEHGLCPFWADPRGGDHRCDRGSGHGSGPGGGSWTPGAGDESRLFPVGRARPGVAALLGGITPAGRARSRRTSPPGVRWPEATEGLA